MRYSSGFKASAVRKIVDGSGRSINDVAKEVGIYPATLSDWIRQHNDNVNHFSHICGAPHPE